MISGLRGGSGGLRGDGGGILIPIFRCFRTYRMKPMIASARRTTDARGKPIIIPSLAELESVLWESGNAVVPERLVTNGHQMCFSTSKESRTEAEAVTNLKPFPWLDTKARAEFRTSRAASCPHAVK